MIVGSGGGGGGGIVEKNGREVEEKNFWLGTKVKDRVTDYRLGTIIKCNDY